MSTIRIFPKKTFAIGPGAQKGSAGIDQFITVPLSFQDMPERYANDPTFLAAVKSGDITIVNNPTMVTGITPSPATTTPVEEPTEKETEEETTDEEVTEEKEEEDLDSVEEYKESLKKMKAEEVKAEAEKYNANFVDSDPLKQNKKRVLEAYKLSLN